MNLELKILPFEMKATEGDGSEFEGIASGFNNVDSYGDIICPGAFKDTLPQFLSDGFIGGLNHDWDNPIGKPTKAKETALGLEVGAKISDTTAGRDVKILLKDGVIKKLSIGFMTLMRTWLDTAEEVMAYWESVGYTPSLEDTMNAAYGVRLLQKVRLFEFSPVTVPANSLCDITNIKSGSPAGLTFDDHSHSVLATVEEFIQRAEGLRAKRAEDGRSLAPQKLAQFKRLRDRLDGLMTTGTPIPPETLARASDADVQRVLRAYTETSMRYGALK